MREISTAARVGGGLALGLGVAALVAPRVWHVDPIAIDVAHRLAPPSADAWLGYDALGRDVFARLVFGARLSFGIAIVTVIASVVVGGIVGTLAALGGRWVDEIVSRIIDVLLAFPGLLLTLALAAILGPSVPNVVIALVALGWTSWARLVRVEMHRGSTRLFVEASRALGAPQAWIVIRHLVPHAAPTLLVQATFACSSAIMAEASLSFLGVGVPAPWPSWGTMLDEGREFLLVAPHLVVWPGLALATTVFALQLLGDGLRDWLDVRDARQR